MKSKIQRKSLTTALLLITGGVVVLSADTVLRHHVSLVYASQESAAEEQQEVSEEQISVETQGETEEPIADSSEEPPVPVKTEYVYEEEGVLKVTATLSDPVLIDDDAELVITPVKPNSEEYDYDAYLEALNEDAKANGYTDLLPYLCATDHVIPKLIHAKLIRTHTCALGSDSCDYWYVGDESETAKNFKGELV